MKRIISILALSIFMISGAYAEPKSDNANAPKEESTVVDSTKAGSPATVADNEEPAKTASVKSTSKEPVEDSTSSQSSLITLIALIISVIALALAAFVFIFSKKRYEELYGRYRKLKDDLKNLPYEITGDLNRRIDSNEAKFEAKINAAKEEILEELRAVQTPKVEEPEVIADPELPKFISRTFYGIYKPKAKGVYLDQITDIRDGGSTFEIETISETEALVHLVDNLSKTQFSGLMGDAVEVTEGNPQSYENITEVEAGRMALSEETWAITKKILVKLS